jgi:hypothetical protein
MKTWPALQPATDITCRSAAQELQARRAARNQVAGFVAFTKPDYILKPFHEAIAAALDRFEAREIRKLMVLMPPQHGKTELVTRRYTSYRLGRNPDTKVAIAAYAAEIAEGFGRDVQRIIDCEDYHALFPGTALDGSSFLPYRPKGAEGGLRNAARFEIVGRQGFVKTVGAGGPLTSMTVDLGIIDDLFKDRAEAKSPTIQEKRWEWYVDVFETRLHNDSQQLFCSTRWDEGDVAGRVLKRDGEYSPDNPDGWVVLKFEGLKVGLPTSGDQRQPGEALFPEKHSQHKLEQIKKNTPITFNSLYQQDPRPSVEALVYPMWQQVPEVPEALRHVAPYFGLDFGFTNDPTALTELRQHNALVCADEWLYGTGMSNADIKLAFLAKGGRPQDVIYADSAEPKSIADLRAATLTEATPERQAKHPGLKSYLVAAPGGTMYRLPGLNVRPAVKGPDSVDAGISMLRNDVQVVVTQRSTHVWAERNRYEFIMHDGKSTNVPRDRDNHAMDGIRYGIYSNKRGTYTGF